uniref:Uncharacterized protein n=1 Tax=Romanomermis culicivorax TaxID=13658 RepID=A0A915HVP5_ROMCU
MITDLGIAIANVQKIQGANKKMTVRVEQPILVNKLENPSEQQPSQSYFRDDLKHCFRENSCS